MQLLRVFEVNADARFGSKDRLAQHHTHPDRVDH